MQSYDHDVRARPAEHVFINISLLGMTVLNLNGHSACCLFSACALQQPFSQHGTAGNILHIQYVVIRQHRLSRSGYRRQRPVSCSALTVQLLWHMLRGTWYLAHRIQYMAYAKWSMIHGIQCKHTARILPGYNT